MLVYFSARKATPSAHRSRACAHTRGKCEGFTYTFLNSFISAVHMAPCSCKCVHGAPRNRHRALQILLPRTAPETAHGAPRECLSRADLRNCTRCTAHMRTTRRPNGCTRRVMHTPATHHSHGCKRRSIHTPLVFPIYIPPSTIRPAIPPRYPSQHRLAF